MKRSWLFMGVLFTAFLILIPPGLFSQASYWSSFRFEVSTALSYQKSLLDASYLHRYSPQFLSGAFVSNAEQTLSLEGRDAWGMNISLAYFPLDRLGLQLLIDYGKPEIGGQNSDYELFLNYSLDQNPGPPPYPMDYERTYIWPKTKGNLRQACLSLNAVTRVPLVRQVALQVSGGLTYFRVDGKASSLGFTVFRVEEDAFIEETTQMIYKFNAANRLGLNVGANLDLVLYSNLCFTVDARAFVSSKFTRTLDLEANGLSSIPIEQIRAVLNLGKIEVNPSLYRVNFGLKYLF
ncbi:MAG: hypothetical protein AB1715_06115 [Acidobacteriota bacterium]